MLNVQTPTPGTDEGAPKAGGAAKKDPKAKGAPVAAAPEVDEGIETGNEVKITVDNGNADESQRVLSFSLNVVFQGEPYEDPNPPEIDEAAQKKAAKGKAVADEPEIRMITPEPLTMVKESGRQFQVELGRYQMVKMDTESVNEQAIASQNSTIKDGTATANDTKGSKLNTVEGEEGEDQMVKKWFQYRLDHSVPEDSPATILKATEEGILNVDGLTFNIDE